MFYGPPLPLAPRHSLNELIAYASTSDALGAWVRGCPQAEHVIGIAPETACRVLASPDLGLLLSRCDRVLVREGDRPVVLETAALIQWRALQVAISTPYLPGIERLRDLFPGLRPIANGVLVPLHLQSPEEILTGCLAQGMQVSGSRIVYSSPVSAQFG